MPYVTRLGRNRLFRLWYGAFTAATILNFAVFVAITSYIGGDAVNGKAEAGHYYVFGDATRDGQKVYTEVSETVYNYSRWHVYSLFITWPLMMVGAPFVMRRGQSLKRASLVRILRRRRRRVVSRR